MSPAEQTLARRYGTFLLIHTNFGTESFMSRFVKKQALMVRVEDLQGFVMYSKSTTDSVLEIPLCPGTFHVFVEKVDACRGYTLNLKQGETYDLFIRKQIQ